MPVKPDPPPFPTPHPTETSKLIFKWEDWLPYLAAEEATDDEKRAMIEAVWSIVVAFVDLGWEVDGSSEKSCGQVLDLKAALEAAVLHSDEVSDDTSDGPANDTADGRPDAQSDERENAA